MNLIEKKIIYMEEEQVFQFKDKLQNWIELKSTITFNTDKFLDYQKDLIQEFFANFIDQSSDSVFDLDEVKQSFEIWLQDLNTKLKVFADKVRDVDFFSIKWYIQIIADSVLMTTMIWNVTIMIFRDGKMYYSLHNSMSSWGKIDLFSDFIEWDVQKDDQLIYLWTKVLDVVDNSDIKEIESILRDSDSDIVSFLEEVISSRMDKTNLWFISSYMVGWGVAKSKSHSHNENKYWAMFSDNPLFSKLKKNFVINKYYITIWILTIVILFMLYSVLSQILSKNDGWKFLNDSWTYVDITIEDIKKDIYLFQSIDPASDEKWIKYNDIIKKLDTLEIKWRRLWDVKELRKILKAEYNKWFNVIYISNLDQLDEATKKTTVFNFNSNEKEKLWEFKYLFFGRELFVVWNTASLLNIKNNDMRWVLMEYWIDESISSCSITLTNDWVYCNTPSNHIYAITKSLSTIQPVTTTSEWWFPSSIAGMSTYWKSYLYVFQPNLNTLWAWTLVTRYRNILWKQTEFTEWQDYSLEKWLLTWMVFWSWFSSFAVDGTFIVWDSSQKKLFQFRRPNPAWTTFQAREVSMVWWDKFTTTYWSNVKVISNPNSKYVYLFDKTNQTVTVYESRPLKTNETFAHSYSLYYLLRYTFDLEWNKIIDISIPDVTWDKPEMYILSDTQINKVDLYDFIWTAAENQVQ